MDSHINALDWIALVLIIIGGLNWGLVGLFNVDVVAAIFGTGTVVTRTMYVIVGLGALYALFTSAKMGRIESSLPREAHQM